MKNRVRKYTCFKCRCFGVFLGIRAPFRLQFLFQKSSKIQNPSPGALQKVTKKRPRCLKNGFWDVFWIRLFSKAGLGRVLGGFGEDLGWILKVVDYIFWEDFWLIFIYFRLRWFGENHILSRDSLQKTRIRRFQNCMTIHRLLDRFYKVV